MSIGVGEAKVCCGPHSQTMVELDARITGAGTVMHESHHSTLRKGNGGDKKTKHSLRLQSGFSFPSPMVVNFG